MVKTSVTADVLSWVFGVVVLTIGLVNLFWGNDPGFGAFVILLAFIYFPPANELFRRITRFPIPLVVKILVGVFILWAAMGVGELTDKIEMMMSDLK